MGKAIFFDIDGTIWDSNMQIPDSAVQTIAELKRNGHLTFICTGRSRANVTDERLMDMGFDGIVAACGNYVEMGGRVLYNRLLDHDLVRRIVDLSSRCRMPVVLEGPVDYWISSKGFENDPFIKYLHESMDEHAIDLEGYSDDILINKFSSDILPETDYATIKKELEPYLDLLEHEHGVLECIPKGTGKSAGIRWVCEHLGVDHADTYACGDSVNDVDMLEYAAHSIVMGNGSDVAKAYAEYITTDLHEDGIRNAMLHYGLI